MSYAQLVADLQEAHRDLLSQIERRRAGAGKAHRGPLPLLLDACRGGRLSPLVAYAQLWATEGAHALWQLERLPATAMALAQLDGEEELRSLLELPLTRLEAYEDVATELGSVMCEAAGAGTAEQLTELLLGLDEMRERVGAALAPLGRLAPLWGVQARFKSGEVAFLVKRFLVHVCVWWRCRVKYKLIGLLLADNHEDLVVRGERVSAHHRARLDGPVSLELVELSGWDVDPLGHLEIGVFHDAARREDRHPRLQLFPLATRRSRWP